MKVGILGGGQLGRMMLQAAANYPVETFVLETDEHCPSAHLCHQFVKGDIRNYEDVFNFGKKLDAVTIEIESVNADALEALQELGVAVFPEADALRIIKDKVKQKRFYLENEIPTAPFVITERRFEIENHPHLIPGVHKIGLGGYDGRGVQMIQSKEHISLGFDEPSVLEKIIPIQKEIAQIVAINQKGETALYPPVDMVFNPDLNLLDYQISPAELTDAVRWKVEAVALKAIKALRCAGIFAVELFLDKKGDIYLNEIAPRVHNSGHHTIEANYSSQFDMLWRIILGYPLGNTAHILPAALINIVGSQGAGNPVYEGLDEVLKMDNAFIHIYGKRQSKPGRKMGHVTLLSADRSDLTYKANKVKHSLKAIGKT